MIPKELDDKIVVNEDGTIYSLLSKRNLALHERSGYLKITIYFPEGLKQYNVHRLVAEQYIPNPENLPCVNHKDGNKHNNAVSNLEWCTYKENSEHASEMGLFVQRFGEDNPQAKLTDEIVTYCRSVYIPRNKEFGGSALARKFNISQQVMSKALSHETWNNISRNVAGSQNVDGEMPNER